MICLGLLFCLVSCVDHVDENTSTTSITRATINDEAVPPPNMSGDENDTRTVTYVRIGGDADVIPHYFLYLPVSYVKGGIQTLTEENWQKTFAGTESMYMTSGDFEKMMRDAPTTGDISKIDADAMYAPGSDRRESDGRMDSISSNGAWDFFPAKVAYEKYTLESQPKRAEWSEYFKGEIERPTYSNGSLSAEIPLAAPVVITESWVFEWDGVEAALVTASNAILSGEYGGDAGAAPNPPPGENTIVYTISALFVGDRPPVLLHERYSPLNSAYFPLNAVTFTYSQYMSAVQASENGELMLCPIFSYDVAGDTSDYILSFKPDYMICDIDGDGKAELIQYNHNYGFSSLFCNYSVWELIEGEAVRVFVMRLG